MFWIRQQLVNKMGLVQTDTTEQTHVFGTAAPVGHWGKGSGSAGGGLWCTVAGVAWSSFPLLSSLSIEGDNDMALQMFL